MDSCTRPLRDRFQSDGRWSRTAEDQVELEDIVVDILEEFQGKTVREKDEARESSVQLRKEWKTDASTTQEEEKREMVRLKRNLHVNHLHRALGRLPKSFRSLDASRVWIVYWSVHGLSCLEAELTPPGMDEDMFVDFIRRCQHPNGGIAGCPGHLPHLAASYAGVAALITIGTESALACVDRKKMERFLLSMCRDPSVGGGATMHEGGEIDIRGVYAMLAIAHMLGLDKRPFLERGIVDFVQNCQTFDGGIAAEPTCEAHGGYTYCGLAALALVGKIDALDLPRLVHWLVHRQDGLSGGFQGRTEKLVDGCYSWWQGASFSILQEHFAEYLAQTRVPTCYAGGLDGDASPPAQGEGAECSVASMFPTEYALDATTSASRPVQAPERPSQPGEGFFLYNPLAQQAWSLICCQDGESGGLKDKPGVPPDFYHTCYNLAGIAAAQHVYRTQALGGDTNLLPRVDPTTCVLQDRLQAALHHFHHHL